jgi:hypothetical protein
MRIRAYLFLLVGLVCLVFATCEFLDAAYFTWRTAAPIRTGRHARTRILTQGEAKEFADIAKERLGHSGLWVVASAGPFVAFVLECWRARRRRRAVEQADEADDPAAGTLV